MNAEQLRTLQTPVKSLYKERPEAARHTLRAEGSLDPAALACGVETYLGQAAAGLHAAAGGDGTAACSGDMLLESLAACAGVTLLAVATALEIPVRGGKVVAEGDLDFRGTLGVSKETPVGFSAIRLRYELDSDATAEQRATLLKLAERYCVIWQTLKNPATLSAEIVS